MIFNHILCVVCVFVPFSITPSKAFKIFFQNTWRLQLVPSTLKQYLRNVIYRPVTLSVLRINAIEQKSPAVKQPICTFYSLHNTAQYTSQHRPLIETEPPRTQLPLSRLATTGIWCVCTHLSLPKTEKEKKETVLSHCWDSFCLNFHKTKFCIKFNSSRTSLTDLDSSRAHNNRQVCYYIREHSVSCTKLTSSKDITFTRSCIIMFN